MILQLKGKKCNLTEKLNEENILWSNTTKNQKLISELIAMFVWTVTQALTFNLIPNLISLRRSRLRGRRERETCDRQISEIKLVLFAPMTEIEQKYVFFIWWSYEGYLVWYYFNHGESYDLDDISIKSEYQEIVMTNMSR